MITLDLTPSIAPDSDQLNADDLIAGPVTVTIAEVTRGTLEQPFNFVTEEFGKGRAYRPSKSMRRVMVECWGPDAGRYGGRQLTLYRDPKVRFGNQEVGGIKISHLSHIDQARDLKLTAARGHRATHHVEPLITVELKTPEQSQRLHSLLQARGFDSREAASRYIASVLGAEVGWADLTSAQATVVLSALDALHTTNTAPEETP